jgi:hypothetical protein
MSVLWILFLADLATKLACIGADILSTSPILISTFVIPWGLKAASTDSYQFVGLKAALSLASLGLGDIAITSCYAAPVFGMLIGFSAAFVRGIYD